VIIASRNQERVSEAVAKVKELQPAASVEGMMLNLSSFSSIDRFVAEVKNRYNKVDVLINNAGLGMSNNAGTRPSKDLNLLQERTSWVPLISPTRSYHSFPLLTLVV
jgi:short-subunit dehydrogenase involved in D-alanine esterification of teichoic acids